MLAVMKFMVMHNDAHAQELADLAVQLQEAGREKLYRRIMDCVSSFDMVNADLDAVVQELSEEVY